MVSYNKKYLLAGLAIFFCFLAIMPLAAAESLWSDQKSAGNMFVEFKAHGVGDIVTIVINEASSAVKSGKTNNSKSADVQTEAGSGIFKWLASAGAASSDKVNTQGLVSNTNTVQAKITAKVTAVKPNGNLLIEGTQQIKQNKEEQKIIITGEIRPQDISKDNIVLSSYIANAEIRIDGHGAIASKQKQGILTQIFNFLF